MRVEEPAAKDALPTGRDADQRLGDRGQSIADEGDRLSTLELVGKRAGEALHNILGGLGDAFDQADKTAAGLQDLGEEDRQNRIEHLAGDVGEQTREG